MKSKILLVTALLLTTLYTTHARTPRLSKKGFTYEALKLPMQKLPSNRTFTVAVETAAEYGPIAIQRSDEINIPGWTKTVDQSEYMVDVLLHNVAFDMPRIVERCEYIKDTADVIIDTIYFYRNIYRGVASGHLEVLNAQNEIVFSTVIPDAARQFEGKEFRRRKAAKRYTFREGMAAQRDMMIDFYSELSAKTNAMLDHQFGIYPIKKREALLIVRNKKHKEYSRMQLLWNQFNNISDQVNLDIELQDIERDLQHSITYLKNIEQKYTGRSKADCKMRYIAQYNLSTIYLMLELPEQAMEHAHKLRSNGFNKNAANSLIVKAKFMKRLSRIHS